MMKLPFRRLCWLIAMIVPALPALGDGHASYLPSDVDVYAELNGATPDDWRFAAQLAGPGVSIDESWRELARVVGLDEQEAFSRLLGERVSLALRSVWSGESDWAALLTTDVETAEMIRRKLKARPRRIVGGQTVLRLPGGRYEFTEFRNGGSVTVMLAPVSEGASLFGDACVSPEETLDETARLLAFDDLDHGPHFLAVHAPGAKGWLTGAVEVDEGSARVRLVGRFSGVDAPRPVFTPEAWDELFDGALFAIVERGQGLFEGGTLESIPALEPVLHAMGESAGEVVLGVVRAREGGGVVVGGAASLAGPESRAERLDRGAARSLAIVRGALGQVGEEIDFRGDYPRALRTAPITMRESVSWRYLGDGWQPGWVVAGNDVCLVNEIAETARGEAERMRFHVTLDGEGGEGLPMAAWRSVGLARPAALLGAIGDAGGALAGFSGVDVVRWRLRDLPSGRVDGEIELKRAE